jgi:NADPH:quinone reductase-like Zn-dependent oxidoreductase
LREITKLDLPKPLIGQRYIFKELPEAVRHFKSGKTMGKVVISVD